MTVAPAPGTVRRLRWDIASDFNRYGDRSWKSRIIVFCFKPGFQLSATYRLSRYLVESRSSFASLCAVITYVQQVYFGCEISPASRIGPGLKLPHALGVVIGRDVVVGENVTIFQQVTLGSHGRRNQLVKYPTIEDNCVVFAGAKIVGGLRIGAAATVGANAVVVCDVPAGRTVVGNPARLIVRGNDADATIA